MWSQREGKREWDWLFDKEISKYWDGLNKQIIDNKQRFGEYKWVKKREFWYKIGLNA